MNKADDLLYQGVVKKPLGSWIYIMASNNVSTAAEIITVAATADQVMCDGGGGPLGHPTVYYVFDHKETVECLYCDRIFIKAKGKKS